MTRQGECGAAPPAKARAIRMAGRATEAAAGMSRLPGGPHDLANEGVRLAAAAPAISNAAKLDAEIIVTRAQGCPPLRKFDDGGERVEMFGVLIGSAGRGVRRVGKIASSDQPLAPVRRRRFYLAIARSVALRPHASRPNARQHAKSCEPGSSRSLRPPFTQSAHEQ